MNIGIGNWDCGSAISFLGIFLSRIFGIVSLQCGRNLFKKGSTFWSDPKMKAL
jgi:hypothetical protein